VKYSKNKRKKREENL